MPPESIRDQGKTFSHVPIKLDCENQYANFQHPATNNDSLQPFTQQVTAKFDIDPGHTDKSKNEAENRIITDHNYSLFEANFLGAKSSWVLSALL